jgi:hypothetical protein
MEHTEELVNEYKQRIQEKPLKEGGKVTKWQQKQTDQANTTTTL